MLKRKTNTKFATGKEEPVGMLIGLLPIGKLGGADSQSPDHVYTMAWGPIVLPSSSWIEKKEFHEHRNKASNYQTENVEIQYKHVILSLTFSSSFWRNKQKNNFSTISLMLLPFLPKLWQNTTNLIHPYFAAAPRNLNGCNENQKTVATFSYTEETPHYSTNRSLFTIGDQLCKTKTSFCYSNSRGTTDAHLSKHCLFYLPQCRCLNHISAAYSCPVWKTALFNKHHCKVFREIFKHCMEFQLFFQVISLTMPFKSNGATF